MASLPNVQAFVPDRLTFKEETIRTLAPRVIVGYLLSKWVGLWAAVGFSVGLTAYAYRRSLRKVV